MSVLNAIPSWLGAGIFSTLTFVLGFFSKQYIDSRQARTKDRIEQLHRLERLALLLRDSWDTFRTQNDRVRQLMISVRQNHPGEVPKSLLGYDDTFHFMYVNNKYTLEERRRHELIRSITLGRLHQVNAAMQEWLDQGYEFLSAPGVSSDLAKPNRQLRMMLDKLRTHLTWWLGQYDVTMSNDPARALVYSNDEARLGEPFPTGIQDVLDEVITLLRRRVKS